MVTAYPLDWSNFASEAEIIPFPNEEVTPPVTKMYFVEFNVYIVLKIQCSKLKEKVQRLKSKVKAKQTLNFEP